ncbi:hypothetical protein CU098_011825, partial [Rhizopus stolonifer]
MSFSDSFWESIDKNGITILMERMRGAKQTCERFKHAYEARALLEEEYGKTLLQIAQKQKPSSVENGSSRSAMNAMQKEFISIAESHLHLSNLLRENINLPLTKLLNRQKSLRKELQTSIQKLYNNRQLQVHFVRRAHKRHNLEIEKANLLVQQQTNEKDKMATFKAAEVTIDKLKKVYDEGLKDLKKVIDEWNTEWKKTCESFEKLEQERLEFFKSNLSNCANLMLGNLENEVQACERINSEALNINIQEDLTEFVKENKSSTVIPNPMEYIKIHAYYEANQEKDSKHSSSAFKDTMDNDEQSESEDRSHVPVQRKRSSTVSGTVDSPKKPSAIVARSDAESDLKGVDKQITAEHVAETPTKEPVLMVGVMEVYPSDEEEDEEEYEYITETESEPENEGDHEKTRQEVADKKISSEVEEINIKEKSVDKETRLEKSDSVEKKEDQSSRLQQVQSDDSPPSLLTKHSFETNRRVSFIQNANAPLSIKTDPATNTPSRLEQYASKYMNSTPTSLDRFSQPNANDQYLMGDEYDVTSPSEAAAFELDDMLRKLDAKRISRTEEENTRQPDIRPTASISSPSLLQKQQQRRSNISSQYFQQRQPYDNLSTRRMSTVETTHSPYGSVRSTTNDFYDPFNSLSSKETGTDGSSKRSSFAESPSFQQPSAQTIRERMLLKDTSEKPSFRRDSFVQDFYNVNAKSPDNSVKSSNTANSDQFIDFAIALYDYDVADEGEIAFKEGDLL